MPRGEAPVKNFEAIGNTENLRLTPLETEAQALRRSALRRSALRRVRHPPHEARLFWSDL